MIRYAILSNGTPYHTIFYRRQLTFRALIALNWAVFDSLNNVHRKTQYLRHTLRITCGPHDRGLQKATPSVRHIWL